MLTCEELVDHDVDELVEVLGRVRHADAPDPFDEARVETLVSRVEQLS